MSVAWLAVGAVADGWRGIALNGAAITAEHEAQTREAVLGACGSETGRIIDICGGEARVPAQVLPEAGLMIGGLDQDTPRDHLTGWVRLAVAGFLAARSDWDGVICAVHQGASFWVQVSADEIVSFQGHATPRLIDALGGAGDMSEGALSDSLSRPERLAAHLRRAEVAGDAGAVTASLIGAELASARAYWLGQAVGVIDAGDAYATALGAQGVTSECEGWDSALRAGLGQAAVRFGFD